MQQIISKDRLVQDLGYVYTAELKAIIIGIQWVEEVRRERVVICLESKVVLTSLYSTKSEGEDLVIETFLILGN